jgi:hypothetical protein
MKMRKLPLYSPVTYLNDVRRVGWVLQNGLDTTATVVRQKASQSLTIRKKGDKVGFYRKQGI